MGNNNSLLITITQIKSPVSLLSHVNRKTNCSNPPLIITCLILQLLHAEPTFSGTNLEFQEEGGEELQRRLGGNGWCLVS